MVTSKTALIQVISYLSSSLDMVEEAEEKIQETTNFISKIDNNSEIISGKSIEELIGVYDDVVEKFVDFGLTYINLCVCSQCIF